MYSLESVQLQSLIQVDIGGHPPFPTSSKQFSGNFGNLLFLEVFLGPKLLVTF
jgi:hypothetical protein